MYTLEKFYNDIRLFTNSLVIKVYETAISMEIALDPKFDPKEKPQTEWKYFLNISGQYHSSDEEVYINVIELEENRLLTKELLEEFPVTKDELLKSEDYYYNLVNEYPGMFLFIHGCLYPVDIQTAIAAENGKILGYNSTFLEPQEYSLIRDIEKYVKNYISRWVNPLYSTIDDLHLPTMLGILYANLPNKIAALRMAKIRTKEAHSFFLQVYFNSNFNLWDSLSVLNEKSLRWLYLNMDYLIKNIGKNSTFQTIIEKILTANSVGIGSYHLHGQDQSLNSDYYDVKKLPFGNKKSIIMGHGLNSSYISNNNSTASIQDVLQKQLDKINFYSPTQESYIIDKETDKINSMSKGEEITKVLEISTLREFNSYNTDMFRVLFDYWTYMLHYGYYGSFTDDKRSTAKVEFVDPSTNKHYNINSKVGYYFAIKILLSACDKADVPLTNVIFSTVFNPDADLNKILTEEIYQDGYTEFYYKYLKDNYPGVKQIYTGYIDVGEFLSTVMVYYKNLWILNSNSENGIVGANLRNFLFKTSLQERVPIHGEALDKTIDELLDLEGYTFYIPKGYDYISSIKELFRVCLGYEVNGDLQLSNFLESFKSIIKELTSYTLQTVGGIENITTYYCYYNTIRPMLMNKGIVKINTDVLEGIPYDQTFFYSTFIATLNSEEIKREVYLDKPVVDFSSKDYISGIVEVSRASDEIDWILPSAQISLTQLPTKEMDRVHLEDDFIIIKKLFQVEDTRKFETAIWEDDTNVWATTIDPETDVTFTLPDENRSDYMEISPVQKAGVLDSDEISVITDTSDITIKPK